MKITTDGYTISESGTIASANLSPISFMILEQPKLELIFSIVFDEGKTEVDYQVTGDGQATMIFRNPTGLGYGLGSPTAFGNINNTEWFVSFRVDLRGENTSYVLYYTFYTKELEK